MSYLSVFAQNVATAEVVARVRPPPSSPRRPSTRPCSASAGAIDPRSRRGPSASRSIALCRPDSGSGASRFTTALSRELPVDRTAVEEALAACAVDPDRRPQTLTVDEWACLAGRLGPLL